jgi:ribosomal protein S18 acetylase RimI-like enzyme
MPSTDDVTVRPLRKDDVGACSAILGRLPEWFGIAAANAAYVESLGRLPAFVAVHGEMDEIVGFIAIEEHRPTAAEITVMGVDPDLHRRGIGHALVLAAEARCRADGVEWLHVKTRGPTTYDDDYERTRRFYRAEGFAELYESLSEWGAENAALVLVKHLPCSISAGRSSRTQRTSRG